MQRSGFKRDHVTLRQLELGYVSYWLDSLGQVEGLELEVHSDWTGNPIDRVKVTVIPEQAGLYAWELADRLAAGEPSVRVRDDLIEHGYFFLDPCNLKPGQEKIVSRLREEVEQARTKGDGLAYDLSTRRNRQIAAALHWLDG